MSPEPGANADFERMSKRFTRVFLAIMLLGLASSAAVALIVDPFGAFGTGGRIPPAVPNERESKPESFLATTRPPQLIVLGSSRVMKLNPTCVEELTGLPTFNFGFGNNHVEDMYAVTRFVDDHARAPVRQLLIGCDVEAFDDHVDPRLETASNLRGYLGYSGMSWAAATRAMFGWDALISGVRSVWFFVRPQSHRNHRYFGPDGFENTPDMDEAIRQGTHPFEAATAAQEKRVKQRATESFDALAPKRVEMFRELVRSAHAKGIAIDVFLTPMSQRLTDARRFSETPKRDRELDQLLADLEREGSLHYHRLSEVADLSNDPHGFSDGVHMTERTATRLLLRLLHREHGCAL